MMISKLISRIALEMYSQTPCPLLDCGINDPQTLIGHEAASRENGNTTDQTMSVCVDGQAPAAGDNHHRGSHSPIL